MGMRLRVREVAERYGVNRYELGRRAKLSNPTMDEYWLRPEEANPRLRTLERLASALTFLIRESSPQSDVIVTALDLLENMPDGSESS